MSEKIKCSHLEKNIAIYKKNEHIKLIEDWCGDLKGKTILKTDLYEEAFGEDQLLFWFLGQRKDVFGIDISFKITKSAESRAKEFNPSL